MTTVARVGFLAPELPHATGMAKEEKKRKKDLGYIINIRANNYFPSKLGSLAATKGLNFLFKYLFFAASRHMEFPGQGSAPSCSSTCSHASSLAHAPGTLVPQQEFLNLFRATPAAYGGSQAGD